MKAVLYITNESTWFLTITILIESAVNWFTPDHKTGSLNSLIVEDASYWKIQTVRLSYKLPSALLKGTLRSVEVYVSGLNLATFTDYQGIDPSLNPYGTANFRIDWNGYPSARTLMFGLNIGF